MKTGKRRLAAFAVVAATMVLALVGVAAPAWAEGQSTNPQLSVTEGRVTITSKLTMDKYAVEPNADFKYTIAPAEASELTNTGMPATAGVEGAVSLSPSSVNYSAEGLSSEDNADGVTKTITAQMSVSLVTGSGHLSIQNYADAARAGWPQRCVQGTVPGCLRRKWQLRFSC